MRIKLFLSIILVCSIVVPAQMRKMSKPVKPVKTVKTNLPAVENNSAAQLPIKRVILYSNGVAYVERRGVISGNAEVNLSFKQSQVDDVLKSMVVLDLGQGKVGAVSYNSSAPVGARMAEIPFSVGALTSEGGGIAGVLAQLQGAKVAVTSTKGAATGAILTVERRQIKTEKETLTTSVLVIASETGEISTFDLNDVKSLKLLDAGTQRDLNEFSNAAASARRRDAKTITITSDGSGSREMIVSYTIAAPIWKTTYRVVLDDAGKPFFQGWAIVDNVSEEDWQNVQLSLVSGSPISFIQQLQKPFYRYRPIVPTSPDLQLNPQVYEPGGNLQNNNINQQQIQNMPVNGRRVSSELQVTPGAVNSQVAQQNSFIVDGQEASNFRTGQLNSNNTLPTQTTVSDALTSSNNYQNSTTGAEIGDLFQYLIEQPVTVLRDKSALIPIIQTKMDGERAAIYNEAVRRDRPMSGLLLKNMTDLTFEAGSLTVLDGNAYAGEALMDRLKAKEQRLISFALDLGTHIRVRTNADREPAKIVKVVNGIFQVHYFQTSEKVYQIENQTNRPKVLYVEYPVQDGWTLSDDTPKPDYTTQKYHRFRVALAGFEKTELKIRVRQALADNYQLTSLSRSDLQLFVSQRYINEETRAKLEKLIDLRIKINEIENRLNSFDEEVEKIEEDQKRLRENIEALSKTPEAKTLIARYIAKANDQETRLEEMEKERKTLEAEQTRLEAELTREIRAFTISE